MKKYFYVYILTNKTNKILYTGMTNNLAKRLIEHKNKLNPKSFTSLYNVGKLIYYEIFQNAYEAIIREKAIKRWKRTWKLELIASINPCFEELEPPIL